MSLRQFLEVWGIVPADPKPEPPPNFRYTHEWREWMDEAIDQVVEMSTNGKVRDDEFFRHAADRIDAMPDGQRHIPYELLLSYIGNNHPYGMAADIYDEINTRANENNLKG